MKSIAIWLAVFALLLVGCERLDNSYSDFHEFVESDAMQSGWFPEWLPESAYDIKETHDIDTNQSMLVFAIRERGWRPPPPCLTVEPAKLPPPPYARSWWPASHDFETRPGYSFYSCPDKSFVGVDDPGQRVFHWRPFGT